MGKLTIELPFSIAILNHQGVTIEHGHRLIIIEKNRWMFKSYVQRLPGCAYHINWPIFNFQGLFKGRSRTSPLILLIFVRVIGCEQIGGLIVRKTMN